MTDQETNPKVGDIVVLKSGSPKMTVSRETRITVTSIKDVPGFVCQWSHKGEIKEMKCLPEALLLAKDHPELVEQE